MANSRRPKVRIAPPKLDGPPAPTKVDLEIARNHGSSMAIDATREKLQASKNTPTPSMTEIIADLNRRNGRLTCQLLYADRMRELGTDLLEEATFILERLRMAVINFKQGQKDIENEFRMLDNTAIQDT